MPPCAHDAQQQSSLACHYGVVGILLKRKEQLAPCSLIDTDLADPQNTVLRWDHR